MKIGLLEIVLILVVAFSVLLLVRLFRENKRLTRESTNNTVAVGSGQEITKGNHRLKNIGVLLVVLGVIVLLLGFKTFEYVMRMYLWAFIMAGVGIVALLLSRKR